MDALSPAKTCDPWAVHCAKSFENLAGTPPFFTEAQEKILAILKETGGIERSDLVVRMGPGLSEGDVNREFAALRHQKKVRAEKRGGKVFLRLW